MDPLWPVRASPSARSPQIFHELIELRDQAGLEAVIRGTGVRGVLAGHLHYSTHPTFAGVPVSVASATCYTNDPLLSQTRLRAQADGHAFDLVHVYGDRMLHTTSPVGEFPTVYEFTAVQAAQIFALPVEQQQELARRYVTVGELSGGARAAATACCLLSTGRERTGRSSSGQVRLRVASTP